MNEDEIWAANIKGIGRNGKIIEKGSRAQGERKDGVEEMVIR